MKIFKNRYGEIRSGYKIVSVLLIALIFQGILSGSLEIIFGKSMLLNSSAMGAIITLMYEAIFIFIPILYWCAVENKKVSKMGLINIKKGYKQFIIGLALGAITISIVAIVLILFNQVEIKFTTTTVGEGVKVLLFSLITYISVGFAEEILGRGYIMSILKRTRNKYAVIIISSLIFAAMHLANPGISLLAFFNITLIGVLFAYMFMKSKNIWMSIGYHITWNYFQGAVWGFSVSGTGEKGICSLTNLGDGLINGGTFGPEGGIVVTIVVCCAFIFVYKYYKGKDINSFMNME